MKAATLLVLAHLGVKPAQRVVARWLEEGRRDRVRRILHLRRQGYSIPAIAERLQCREDQVRRTLLAAMSGGAPHPTR